MPEILWTCSHDVVPVLVVPDCSLSSVASKAFRVGCSETTHAKSEPDRTPRFAVISRIYSQIVGIRPVGTITPTDRVSPNDPKIGPDPICNPLKTNSLHMISTKNNNVKMRLLGVLDNILVTQLKTVKQPRTTARGSGRRLAAGVEAPPGNSEVRASRDAANPERTQPKPIGRNRCRADRQRQGRADIDAAVAACVGSFSTPNEMSCSNDQPKSD